MVMMMMVMMMMVMMMTRMPAIVSGGASGSNDHRGEDELPDSWESPCLNIEAPVRKCFKPKWNHKIMIMVMVITIIVMLMMKFFGWILRTTTNVFNRSEMMIILIMMRNQLNIKCHDRKCFQSLRNEQALYHHSMVFKTMVDSKKAIQDNVNEWKSLGAHCNLVKVSPTIPMMDLPPF